MKIPLFRPAACAEATAERWTQACAAVLRSGHYVLGPQVRAFEAGLSSLLQGREAVALNSGSDALLLALQVLGVGSVGGGHADDEVLLPAYTFVACAEAVVRAGARPVFVDSAADDFLPSLEHYRNAESARTRAILAVGLFGDATGLPRLAEHCRARGLWLIEDVAQCLGATAADASGESGAAEPAGTWGDATAMSFYPTKTLGAAGDAGAVAFRAPQHAAQARLLRNHGHDGRSHQCLGQNSRMDELQACLLSAALEDFPAALARRRQIAARYLSAWAECAMELPRDTAGHAWNYFVVRLRGAPERQALTARLTARGIAVRAYYETPLHRHGALQPYASGPLPHAEQLARASLALPLYPMLSDEEVDYVIETVRQALTD